MVRAEVDREDIVRRPQVLAHLEHARNGRWDARALVDLRPLRSDRHLRLSRKSDGLAADRIVLAERVAFPVVVHENAALVRVAVEAEAHHVEGFALVPVCGRPDADETRNLLVVVDPDLQPHTWCARTKTEQVVADGEAAGLFARQALVPLRRRLVQVATALGADVAGHALRAPAEVVRGRNVRQVVEAELVTQVHGRVHEAWRVDNDGRLAVLFLNLDEPGDAVVAQDATSRISYAGGTPAMTFSCSRTMPSI